MTIDQTRYGVCGADSWGPWEKNDFTDCFREIVINAGIPLLYSIGSLCIIIFVYIRQKRQKGLNYERLLNDQLSSNYGSIEQTVLTSDDEDNTDAILVRNKIFDYARLLIALILWGLFSALAFVRLRNNDEKKHGDYWVVAPTTEAAVWMYATVLALINITSQQRGILHVRGHMDILNLLVFTSSLLNLRSLYLKFQTEVTTEYAFTLWILAISFVLIILTILEPQDVDDSYSKPNAEGRFLSPETKTSLYSQFMFSWINPLINKGFRQTIIDKDVYEVPFSYRTKNCIKAFHKCLYQDSFLKSLICTLRKELIIQFFYSMGWSIITAFAPPYFLEKILIYVQNYPNNESSQVTAYLYAVGLFLGTVIASLLYQQALYIGRQVGMKTRSIIIGEVYLKALSRKDTSGSTNDEESKNKTGKITNLMAVDASKVAEISAYIFYMYCFPLQIIISISYLYSLLGVSALAGVLTMIIVYPVPTLINQRFETIHKRLMDATDKRMGVINELLQAIRIIKFFAWEGQFRAKVVKARDNELKEIKGRLVQQIYMENIWMALPLAIMVSVFLTYTRILGNDLSAAIAFTSLALFNNLRHAIDDIPAMVVSLIQARVSVNRIEKFLKEPEVSRLSVRPESIDDPVIGFRDASFQWPVGNEPSDDNSNVDVFLCQGTL
ncbi:4034_t:CDS:10 [Ambispora leptoticha]|uniref:4034_t:CDS:1 n=1 Tax=Ambispora leptoticha TaxID=144679 RepID=A0A9N9EZA4_9GLOM|nr:4034_t:CDS:10 [Ambispora leptoticha]